MKNKLSKEDLSLEQKKEIRDSFKIFTQKYEDGLLRVNDLKIAMMSLGLNPSNDEIERIISQLKVSKKNLKNEESSITLDYDEFYDIVHFRVINKKLSFEKESEKMFELLKEDSKEDSITEKDIENLAKHFEIKDKKEDLQKMAKVCDIDKDGKITLKDFLQVLKSSKYQ